MSEPKTEEPPVVGTKKPKRDMDADKARQMITDLFSKIRTLKGKVEKRNVAIAERDSLITTLREMVSTLRQEKASLQESLTAEQATNAGHVATIDTRDKTIVELTARAEAAEKLSDELIVELNSGDVGEDLDDGPDLSLELKPDEQSFAPSSPPPGGEE